MSDSEYDYEPVRGLPGILPPGEQLLWQGSPEWRVLARRAFRVVPVSVYFLLLAAWHGGATWSRTHDALLSLRAAGLLILLGSLAVGLLLLLAWASARATVYSLTNRRIVIRHGIALPMSLNIPLRQIESVGLSAQRRGNGEIALAVPKSARVGYLLTWPHVRPGHYAQPQPALRALRHVQKVGRLLTMALGSNSAVRAETPPAVAPERHSTPTSAAA